MSGRVTALGAEDHRMDVAAWLRGLGLEQYAELFRDNDIDGEILRGMTAEDLKELGISSFGHRRKLLNAIAALGESPRRMMWPSQQRAPRLLSHASSDSRGRAPAADGDVLRSGRLDRALGAARSRRICARCIGAYHRAVAETVGRLRGLCRQVHGRRRPGLFRLSASA